MRLLVVEDEQKIANFIKEGLQKEGHAVDHAADGGSGLQMALEGLHDVIVLDVMLPQLDGLSVLQQLRQKNVTTPVLLLTVRATVEDKVLGLDAGADDYLTKPFAFEEFVARVRALLRRRAETAPPILQVADLVLDPARRVVLRGDREIDLTRLEFALLDYFMRNPGRVLIRTMIADHVWDYTFNAATNTIDVHISHLRKKVNTEDDTTLLHTVHGVGYVLKVP